MQKKPVKELVTNTIGVRPEEFGDIPLKSKVIIMTGMADEEYRHGFLQEKPVTDHESGMVSFKLSNFLYPNNKGFVAFTIQCNPEKQKVRKKINPLIQIETTRMLREIADLKKRLEKCESELSKTKS